MSHPTLLQGLLWLSCEFMVWPTYTTYFAVYIVANVSIHIGPIHSLSCSSQNSCIQICGSWTLSMISLRTISGMTTFSPLNIKSFWKKSRHEHYVEAYLCSLAILTWLFVSTISLFHLLPMLLLSSLFIRLTLIYNFSGQCKNLSFSSHLLPRPRWLIVSASYISEPFLYPNS